MEARKRDVRWSVGKDGRMEGWERRRWRKGGDCLNHRLRGLHGFHRLESFNGTGR